LPLRSSGERAIPAPIQKRDALLVIATAKDAAAARTFLEERNDARWTILCVFGAANERPDPETLERWGVERWLSGCFANVGWKSAYKTLAKPIRDAIAEALLGAKGTPLLVTHAFSDTKRHPGIWQIGNAAMSFEPDVEIAFLELRGEAPNPTPAKGVGMNPPTRAPAARGDVLNLGINGQIVQRPDARTPGILVSPLWSLPPESWHEARELLYRRARADCWHVILADTSYCNPPPDYALPLTVARFSVDREEQEHFRARRPDLELLEFCQSYVTSETVYAPDPSAEKEFDLVCNARLCAMKRHGLLLEALERLRDEGYSLKTLLLHYPKDNADTIETTRFVLGRIERSRLDVTLYTTCGRGNNEGDIARMLNKCRVAVFLSEREGPAFVIPEYLLCDLPVVAYANLRGGGLHFLNPDNSLLFKDENDLPSRLIEALERRDDFRPRASALEQRIGERSGNEVFTEQMAAHGLPLSPQARPLLRHLGQVRLAELCR